MNDEREMGTDENVDSNNDGYGIAVKGALLNALAKGTSILQKDREGIHYPINASSGTVYSGINMLHLAQFAADNGYANPYWMTMQQIRNRENFVKDLEKGAVISYWSDAKYYYRDEFPLGPDGKQDKTKPIIHRKGDPVMVLDPKTKHLAQAKGYEYTQAFNLEAVDPNTHQFRRFTERDKDGKIHFVEKDGKQGEYVVVAKPFILNPDVKLDNPYPDTAKPGVHYKAKDTSLMERFTEDVSRLVNSMYTGAKFTAATYTPDEIKTLQKEIDNGNSPLFKQVNAAVLTAAGKTEQLTRIEHKREEKAQKSHSRK